MPLLLSVGFLGPSCTPTRPCCIRKLNYVHRKKKGISPNACLLQRLPRAHFRCDLNTYFVFLANCFHTKVYVYCNVKTLHINISFLLKGVPAYNERALSVIFAIGLACPNEHVTHILCSVLPETS